MMTVNQLIVVCVQSRMFSNSDLSHPSIFASNYLNYKNYSHSIVAGGLPDIS
jgi:hypothetical protein